MFDIMTMAENIKTYRNKRGLNQYEFAEKLGISPQAVSKWECGQSCPSIENLCVISEILDVSIDTLIGENSDSEKMMIGIDGGGTKTEFVLFSESGRILKRIILDGCNPNTVGMEEAMNILQLGIDTLMKIKGKISGIFVGAAGLDSGNNTSKIKKMLKEKYPKALVLAHPECKQEVLDLVLYHDTVIEPTTKTVRRWLCKIGERRFSQLLDVRMADIKAHAEGTQESRIERCVALGVLMTEILEQEKCFSLKDLAINGKDIISLGVPQGKQIGVILHELLEEVILDTLPNEHDVLLRKAVELIERT